MKSLAYLAGLAALTLAFTTVTFAANKNQANFTLSSAAKVGSTDLQPGDYKSEWKAESGNSVKVDILRHGKTVATVEGKLKDLPANMTHDAVVFNNNQIDEIDFGSRKQAVVFGE
jgi:hypothetical protein